MSERIVHPPKVVTGWRDYLKAEEIQRLEVYDARIDRQLLILRDSRADRNAIRRTAIKRMRRANGKN